MEHGVGMEHGVRRKVRGRTGTLALATSSHGTMAVAYRFRVPSSAAASFRAAGKLAFPLQRGNGTLSRPARGTERESR
jgi:hypothetical protein